MSSHLQTYTHLVRVCYQEVDVGDTKERDSNPEHTAVRETRERGEATCRASPDPNLIAIDLAHLCELANRMDSVMHIDYSPVALPRENYEFPS